MEPRQKIVDALVREELPRFDAAPHLRAFGAGLIDPWGLTGYGMRGAAYVAPQYTLSPERALQYANKLSDWRAESPVASSMASMLIPGMGFGRVVGQMTAREALSGAGPLMGLGGVLGTGIDAYREGNRERDSLPVLPKAPY